VEEDFIRSRTLTFDNYDVFVHFRPAGEGLGLAPTVTGPPEPSGRALVGQLGPDEFLIMGFDAELVFRPAWGSHYTDAQFVEVEEGVYENGVWKRTEIRNGDFSDRGIVLPSRGRWCGRRRSGTNSVTGYGTPKLREFRSLSPS